MAQKVHPTGFRLGINQDWHSVCFLEKANYAENLHLDLQIRKYIEAKLKSAGVVSIKIKRFMNKILAEISVARPGVVIGRGGSGIELVKKELSKLAKRDVEVKLFEIKKPEISAKLIAQNVAAQVERRVVPKFAVQRELENAKNSGLVKGIRVWVSGRIKGAEIARTEKFQWGSVPLQTLRADIDYYYMSNKVPNAGLHGIKVWVNKGEKQELEVA